MLVYWEDILLAMRPQIQLVLMPDICQFFAPPQFEARNELNVREFATKLCVESYAVCKILHCV